MQRYNNDVTKEGKQALIDTKIDETLRGPKVIVAPMEGNLFICQGKFHGGSF
jgi:hypothetical protein